MAIRRSSWPCSSCGKRNDASAMRCTCGSPRENHERPIFDRNAPVVTDPDELARANAGPHKSCNQCGTNCEAGATECPSCGNVIDEGDKDRPIEPEVIYADRPLPEGAEGQRPQTVASAPNHGAAIPVTAPRTQKEPKSSDGGGIQSQFSSTSTSPRLPFQRWSRLAAILLIASLIAWAVYYFLLATHEEYGVVKSLSWSRSISIERKVTEIHEGWSIPADGRKLSSQEKQRSTREVVIGIKKETCIVRGKPRDLGNGYYDDGIKEVACDKEITRTEPVMGTWYKYEVDIWRQYRSVQTSGNDTNTYWGQVQLEHRERRGGTSESYVLYIQNSSEDATQDRTFATSNEAEWRKFPPGSAVLRTT